MSSFAHELRRCFRVLAKSPGFSLVAVLAFALGIGANSAIFSVVNSVLLRPLGYFEPERLVVAEHAGPSPVAPATFLDWQRQAASFEELAAAQAWGGSLRTQDRPQALTGLRVSANLFSLLGVPALRGRTLSPGDDREGAAPVVVLAYSLWQRGFGGAPDIVGRQIQIDGALYTVAGVMPPSFQFAPFWVTNAEIWAPLVLGERKTDRRGNSLRVFGRLRRGVAAPQAQAEMSTIMSRLAREYPDTNAKDTVTVTPLRDRVVGAVQPMLLLLLGTVSFVLLIACANVANLMLARAAGRRREAAVRRALGASPWHLARQALAESAVLAGLGGLIGLGLAYAGVDVLNAMLPAGTMPRQQEVRVDPGVLLFSAALSLATGLLAGLLPALYSSRGDVNETLQEGGRGGGEGRRAHLTRHVLVASEMALAFVLLVGASLMVRSFTRLLSQDAGYDPSHLLSLQVSVSGTRQAEPGRRALFYQQALERIGAAPGVVSAGLINHAPITGDVWGTQFRIDGRPEPAAGEWPRAVYRVVHPGYFATMRTTLVAGRDFTVADNRQAPPVVLINESLARRHWPGQDAVGRRIVTGGEGRRMTVVGVVRDVKQHDWHAAPDDELYFPLLQSEEYLSATARHFETVNFVARVAGDAAGMSQSVRRAIESLDRGVLVSNVISMERAVQHNTWRPRLSLLLLGVFAVVALVLAATGVYGVISHAVSRRTQEIGIRMALGAAPADVLARAAWQGLAPAGWGLAAGAVLSLMLTRLMSSMLFGVKATDPLAFGAAAVVMAAAGILAVLRPALRAARVDPMVALRHN